MPRRCRGADSDPAGRNPARIRIQFSVVGSDPDPCFFVGSDQNPAVLVGTQLGSGSSFFLWIASGSVFFSSLDTDKVNLKLSFVLFEGWIWFVRGMAILIFFSSD